jgi:ABC-2 type transport system ATP-binding protein
MQSPRETSVQALRNTRPVEEICAWTEFLGGGSADRPIPRNPPPAMAAASVSGQACDQALLHVDSISKRYADQTILSDVVFDIRAGEILGIIGPNGASKTTLLDAVAGLQPVDKGHVRWRGKPLPPSRRHEAIFHLPDGVRPYQEQAVARVLTFFADVYRRSTREVGDTIEAIGLAPVLHKPVYALSKGYSRTLLLTLGWLTPHPLLFMDEPFDGLDHPAN